MKSFSGDGLLMTRLNLHQSAERLPRSVLLLSFAGAFLFLYLRTFLLPCTPFIAFSDQVLFFARAVRVMHGQVPYRDFFEFVTPGTHFLYAAAFRLFGVRSWVIQAWGIALGLAMACIITRIAARILRGPLILLPALLFLVLDLRDNALTHHWYSTLAALAAVDILMDGIGPRRVCAAGVLCAISTLFTQTQGALAFVAIVLYLLWRKRSGPEGFDIRTSLAALSIPFLLILSWTLGYYGYKAGFSKLFFDLILFPIRFQSSGQSNSPRTYLHELQPTFAEHGVLQLIPFAFIYVLVPYVYFAGLFALRSKRGQLPPLLQERLVLLHLVGLGLFVAVISGPSFFRLSTVAPPAILVFTWLLSQPGSALRVTRYLVWALSTVLAFAQPIHRQTRWHATLELPAGRTAFTDPLSLHQFQWLSQRTRPFDLFFNDSALCLYLSLTNPTPTEFVNYDEYTRPEQVAAVIQSLQRHPPRFVALLPTSAEPSNGNDHADPFRQYIYANYHLTQAFPLHGAIQYEEQIWELNSKPDTLAQ